MIDTEVMRDLQGRTVHPGMTVKALRRSSLTGTTFDFEGAVVAIRPSDKPGRLEALVQPHRGGEAVWLGGGLVELPAPHEPSLEGTYGEWVER